MASLVAKDSYLQNLAKKICSQQSVEPQKRKWAPKSGDLETTGPPKKKKKEKKEQKKKSQKQDGKANRIQNKSSDSKSEAPRAKNPAITREQAGSRPNGGPTVVSSSKPVSFLAMDILRQRLHEKIKEASGQGHTKELSPAALEKRQRRKQERERKKRKRKEIRAKEKAAKAEAQAGAKEAGPEPPQEDQPSVPELVFNKLEVNEGPISKAQKKKEKRQRVKGNLTPLTGKNYRQLLERVQARKNKLEELKEQDEEKAREMETKMKWTNLLYKAEGVKIRDNEELLKAALKRKEKRRAQRKRQWEKRTAHVVEKMQQRQDKRRKNLRKKKVAKMERRKAKARKKGRILPEDLEKAGLN
ncbi:surfeit locus protein 6 [Sarcophilus harrisii]|uniref:Surfeit 6 n=1 Tax=Sarcophilus harrisii TaxID=9305 RepID=A0A7N4P933_SARHA|nr:surfeit locus protein 6 [Sarcophilus harrisii]XP_012409451.1 surfeit locus protein 6 [Sarcophilus harrisii]